MINFVNDQGIGSLDVPENSKERCDYPISAGVDIILCLPDYETWCYATNCDQEKSSGLISVSSYPNLVGDRLIQFSEPQPSQDETECKRLGFCWYDNKKCYPLGYILEGKYCSNRDPYYFGKYGIETPNFVNQSETGKVCINNYECKTNMCSNNVCINITEQNTFKNDTEKLNYEISTNNINTLYTPLSEPIIYEEKNLIRKIADFFKNLFR